MPSWTRAPPESLMKMNGLPVCSASSITSATLWQWSSPAEPPRTVKSWLARWTSRPSIAAAPVTTPSAGTSLPAIPKRVCRCCANRPTSSKLPASTRASTRSRAVCFPSSLCLAWRSGPPPCSSSALLAWRSPIRSSIVFFLALISGLSFHSSRGLYDHPVRNLTDLDLVGDGAGDRPLTVGRPGLAVGRLGGGVGDGLAHVLGAIGPRAEELGGDLGKHGVSQDILIGPVASRERERLGPQLVPLGLEQIGRPAGDRLLLGVLGGCLDDRRITRGYRLAVVAQHQVSELAGERLVGAHEHVEHRLGADDLAGGRDQRRIACGLAYPGHLREHLLHPVAGPLLLELALHVGDHAAGNLAIEDLGLDPDDLGLESRVPGTDLGEMILDLEQAVLLQPGGVASALEHLDQGLGGVVPGAKAERGDRRVDDVGARLDRLHQADHRDARGGVNVHVNERILAALLLDAPDDLEGRLGPQQGRHVLDADRVRTHLL